MKQNGFPEPNPLNDVAKFHQTFHLPIPPEPVIPAMDRCDLRVNLLQEELDELKEAIEDRDLIGIADALADLQYVLSGAILEFGLGQSFKALFDEVQRSNMSKVCANLEEAEQTLAFYREHKSMEGFIIQDGDGYLVYRTADKKVLKSINYSEADLASIVHPQ
jgi:predicted HAD superfamily Cof-like phosphohydrolase